MDGSPKGDDKAEKSIQNSVPDEASTLWSHRIRHSAVGLVSDAFGGGNAASALSSATSGEGKGESSGASAGPNESSTWAQGHSRSSVPDSSASNTSLQDGGFRSQSGVDGVLQAQGQQELDEFRVRGADLSMEEQGIPYLSKEKGKHVEMNSFSGGVGAGDDEQMLERVWRRGDRITVPPQSRLEQQGDGADVVTLLSDPSFQPGLSFDEVMSAESAGMDEEENPFELSPAEIQFIEKLRATLPPAATHKAPEPTNPLNLLPDLGPPPSSALAGKQSMLQATTTLHAEEGYPYHAHDNGISQNQTHATLEPIPGLEGWVEVINSYHEDVWGYLKPYALAAKAEVEKAQERKEPNPTSGPAVRRLGMILAHLDEDFNRSVNLRR
jgi:hypothetical protein